MTWWAGKRSIADFLLDLYSELSNSERLLDLGLLEMERLQVLGLQKWSDSGFWLTEMERLRVFGLQEMERLRVFGLREMERLRVFGL